MDWLDVPCQAGAVPRHNLLQPLFHGAVKLISLALPINLLRFAVSLPGESQFALPELITASENLGRTSTKPGQNISMQSHHKKNATSMATNVARILPLNDATCDVVMFVFVVP